MQTLYWLDYEHDGEKNSFYYNRVNNAIWRLRRLVLTFSCEPIPECFACRMKAETADACIVFYCCFVLLFTCLGIYCFMQTIYWINYLFPLHKVWANSYSSHCEIDVHTLYYPLYTLKIIHYSMIVSEINSTTLHPPHCYLTIKFYMFQKNCVFMNTADLC